MKKLLFSLPLALLAVGTAFSQAPLPKSDPNTGVMTLEFGHVRNPDGSWRSVKGLKIPFRIEKISARVAAPGKTIAPATGGKGDEKSGGRGAFGPENATAYLADSPGNYIVTPIGDFPSPSVADGARLDPLGVNRPWQQLTVGIDSYSTSRVLIRWRAWSTANAGTGSGVNVFTGSFADFGGYFTLPGTQVSKVTFDISVAGVTAPSQNAFFAQQFRTPRDNPLLEDGEGPFRGDAQSVFSAANPSIGSNDPTYWYDDLGNGPDGIYEADEIEQLGDGNGNNVPSNLLLGITVSGRNTEIARNSAFSWFRGIAISGDLFSLDFNDDDFLVGQRGPVLTSAEPAIQLITESRVPTGFTPISLAYRPTLRVNTPGLQVRTALWDWTSSSWVELTSNTATTTEATYGTFAQGNLGRFVNATGVVRGRIQVRQTGPVLTSGYRLSVDLLEVQFVRP